jgi:hypothetical protein
MRPHGARSLTFLHQSCGRGGLGRKENGRRKKDWWAHKGKIVMSLVVLTQLALKLDGMAYASTNFECMAYRYLGTFSWHVRNYQLS